ncbi:hypothetical protein [Peribacillus glennii]|uniref:Uncharacterized protein n=1 Tax=Peribacillus glennii TaxID=2303991 RepID=A0A372LFA3_9BACI|nr:hypothetical protein [Peribacillus glennii]RFU64981.1 hypothetical protein D0466_03455 [Peribacillus glennii]
MSYKENAFQAYLDSLRAEGVSEEVIKYAALGFAAGFDAGTLNNSNATIQMGMIKTLLKDGMVH